MNKIDFAIVMTAERCNPNGDPTGGNRPRQDYDGYGLMTDVCVKHKIRNQMAIDGQNVLNIGDCNSIGKVSIKEKVESDNILAEFIKKKDDQEFVKHACSKWIDVRTFGQVFALKTKSGSISIGVRGPVTVGTARSLDLIDIHTVNITKCINNDLIDDDPFKKDSSTFGLKYIVDKGVYVSYGSIFPQLAGLTGFSDDDVDDLKQSIIHMLDNDASAARPGGSMSLALYWWTHNCPLGTKSSSYIHRLLHIEPIDVFPYYRVNPDIIPGIELEVYDDNI
ncbi:MAG: type I-C CRISPR-associated protein Cas7/Csd2 [bacterium]|nr:type I-C CRISPR-associated protein Cas7/Csd2 [bacterium]